MPEPTQDFVDTALPPREPWTLLDSLWAHLEIEDKDRIPSDLREAIEEVLGA